MPSANDGTVCAAGGALTDHSLQPWQKDTANQRITQGSDLLSPCQPWQATLLYAHSEVEMHHDHGLNRVI
jgi:hypothetical protein